MRRALDYWWTQYRAGTVYTYRAYAVIAYAVAAGEIDLRYALALPELLRDPQHFTSIQRGLSSFIHPHGLPLVEPRVEGATGKFVEPVFLRRRAGELLFALVNVEQPVAAIPVRVAVPERLAVRSVSVIDPASPRMESRLVEWRPVGERAVCFSVADLQEFAVVAIRVELEDSGG